MTGIDMHVHTHITPALSLPQLIDALDWCLDIGVRCVSVYAFSIDNFRRSASEVDLLMSLAEDKLNTILQVRLCPRS